MEIPKLVKIKEIIKENDKVNTFVLDIGLNAAPGQFLMVWLPGIDEKPFSLSSIGKETTITIEKKGKFTEHIFKLKKGDKIGIRGPYGNGFTTTNTDKACIVAGGLGIAPLKPLIDKLNDPLIILGGKSKNDLLFKKELKTKNVHISTDDGSAGFKGFASDLLLKLLKTDFKYSIKQIYTCGPEIMMRKVVDIADVYKIECETSLERYMRCGFGVCGACVCSDKRVCKDGPVFNLNELKEMKDFSSFAALKNGEKVTLKEYYGWRG